MAWDDQLLQTHDSEGHWSIRNNDLQRWQDFEQSGLTKLNDINDPINCTHYKIALVIDNKGDKLDYHFYRQDNNGYWSHKTGHDPVSNVDASGKLITNPETCDRNYDKKKNDEFNYEIFCGYYAVKYNGGPFTFD